MDNNEIERVAALKFLGLFLDKCMSWKYHISYFEYKIFKSIGLIYKEKSFLIKKNLISLAMYYSYIQAYLNYANKAWESSNKTKFTKLMTQQKDAICIFNNKGRFKDFILNFFKVVLK